MKKIEVYSYTDKTVKKQLNTSFDVALYIVDLLESFEIEEDSEEE